MKNIAIYHPDKHYVAQLLDKFQVALPNHQCIAWTSDIEADYLLTWRPDAKTFLTEGLKIMFALGAGIDAFLSAEHTDELPSHIKIVRLEEAGMGKQMLEFALYAILHFSRDMTRLNQAQKQKQWLDTSTPKRLPLSTPIGVMGLGQLGGFVAQSLAKIGYPVSGYSRNPKQIAYVDCYRASELNSFLAHSEVLINLLPLTEETTGILNSQTFNQLPRGAYIVNLARGKHLVEADLLKALANGQVSGAFLDVFVVEPLPQKHPFWHDDRIIVTPHLAAITLQDEAVKQISQNILAYEDNRPMTGLVNRTRGY